MNNYIAFLEELKQNPYTKMDDYLLDSEIQVLKKWYSSYSKLSYTDTDLSELLLFLYNHGNIDMSPADVYLSTSNFLIQRFLLSRDSFFNMLDSYRKIVYEY